MNEDELQAIRGRIDRLFSDTSDRWTVRDTVLFEDAPALLSEVDRLRAEVERRKNIGLPHE